MKLQGKQKAGVKTIKHTVAGRWCGGGGITFLIATLIVIDAPPAANQE